MNSKTRNIKESQINKIYLIYAFCVVLSSLLQRSLTASEKNENSD